MLKKGRETVTFLRWTWNRRQETTAHGRLCVHGALWACVTFGQVPAHLVTLTAQSVSLYYAPNNEEGDPFEVSFAEQLCSHCNNHAVGLSGEWMDTCLAYYLDFIHKKVELFN